LDTEKKRASAIGLAAPLTRDVREHEDETSLREEDDESYSVCDRGGTHRPFNNSSSQSAMSRYGRGVGGGALEDPEEDEDTGNMDEEDVVTPYSISN